MDEIRNPYVPGAGTQPPELTSRSDLLERARVAERIGISVTSAGPLRSGLIGKGMIYSPAHGDTAFTVPLFDEFMRRTVPAPPTRAKRSS